MLSMFTPFQYITRALQLYFCYARDNPLTECVAKFEASNPNFTIELFPKSLDCQGEEDELLFSSTSDQIQAVSCLLQLVPGSVQ